MTKIAVSLAAPGESEDICSDLRLRRYNVTVLDPIRPEDYPKKAVEAVINSKAEVAVIDYIPEDGASVKLLQAVTDYARTPRFIFILAEEVPAAHILMAVNEGASAILQRPVNLESLANYVERAISGPSRFRHEIGRDNGATAAVVEIERELKDMRFHLASVRKLISYLMSTPLADQRRNVMVVSDSAYQRDYFRKILQDHGFNVIQASNPNEGLAKALEERPRVIISDLEMEGKNGVEFCRDLKIENKFVPCYFIICTANSEKMNSVKQPGNGVDVCIIKPSNESANLELISYAAMGLLL